MFRSIQTAFAALAGACTLTVIAALLLYALASGVRSQALVEERTRALIDGMVEQRVTALAQAQVNRIQAQLQAPLQIATSLARVHTLTALTGDDGMPMANLRREEDQSRAPDVDREPQSHQHLYRLGTERRGCERPDVSRRRAGMLDGRFASWIYRDGGGQMKIDRLSDIEDTRLLDTGIRAGEYYLCARTAQAMRRRPGTV